MAYLGVFEAVRSRLEGKDPFYVPNYPGSPQEPFDPLRPKAETTSYAQVAMTFKRDVTANIYGAFEVPIHYFDLERTPIKRDYPSLTFDVIGITPRYNEALLSNYAYGGETYAVPVTQQKETVLDGVEDLGRHPRMAYRRNLEHPMDILVEIRTYAKEPVEAAMLIQYVYEQFPPRHFLRVPMKDGTYRSWDLLFVEYKDLDSRESVQNGTDYAEREYVSVFTYRVEGYFDNTDRAELVQLVRQRVIRAAQTEET